MAVCMSSGAVQRGGVPVLPESVRVCAALDAGADLVITLPAPYACATAEQFASAGVRLLAALGCDTLVFGAEDPNTCLLYTSSRCIRPHARARLSSARPGPSLCTALNIWAAPPPAIISCG